MTNSTQSMNGNGDAERQFRWFDTTNHMLALASQRRVPLIGTLELTARCNLSCQMCYVRREGADPSIAAHEVSATAWVDIARQALREGSLFLLLSGGEPLLRRDFFEIYDPLSRMGFFLTLFTNATLLGDREVAVFAQRPPSKVVVTLYGATAETYGRVCGDPSAFSRAVAGVRRLVAAGVRTELRATLNRDNVGDQAALEDLSEELVGVRKMETSVLLTPAVRGACTQPRERRLSPEELAARRVTETACDSILAGEAGEPVSVRSLSGSIAREVAAQGGPFAAPPPMFCAGGRGSFWIAWDGRMLPCALMDQPFTLPLRDGFAPSWRQLTGATDHIPGAAECRACAHRPYCSVCPGRLQAETGSFTTTTPYLCELAQRIHTAADAGQG
jgi:radical SAM protein with 4Fe4S-binding SPASM domain